MPQASYFKGVTLSSNLISTSLTSRLRNPFVSGIIDTSLPPTWKGVTLDKYYGTTDLDKHIGIYVVQVGLYIMDDFVLCKALLTSLKGWALTWFTRIPPNFLDYFKTLTT